MEKKGLCMCFNFQILLFRKECNRCNCFPARTSFLNTSYLFLSHYCNARFVPKNGFLIYRGCAEPGPSRLYAHCQRQPDCRTYRGRQSYNAKLELRTSSSGRIQERRHMFSGLLPRFDFLIRPFTVEPRQSPKDGKRGLSAYSLQPNA